MEYQLTELIADQYKVVEKHRGGMSIVYIVLDEFSQKRFAIKTVKEEFLDDRTVVERFCEEVKTWMNIGRHLHVVEAIIYRDVGGQPFMWLEYVDGSDLQKLLDTERRLFAPQVLDYALQVCDAMVYVHSAQVRGQRGVIHRDLKPANIMLDRRLGVKITDFGLAKVYGHNRGLTDVGRGLGTYLYMPPEQFLDAATADTTSDVFSFGACVYATLTGRPPVSGDSVGAVINSILSKQPPTPAEICTDIPPSLSQAVMTCLSKARDGRFADFAALRGALLQARPDMVTAYGEREVRRCEGCGYMSLHEYRVCPVCSGSFEIGAYAALETASAAQAVVPARVATAMPTTEPPPVDDAVAPEAAAALAAEVGELYRQAVALRTAGNSQQALALLRDVLTRDPSHTEARAALDELALQQARSQPKAPVRAYNWSMFHGNVTRSGYTPELLTPPLHRRWRAKVGDWVISSPAAVNGVVYAGGYVERPGRHGRLVALRARDGETLWEADFAHEIVGSPVVLDGRIIYVGCKNSLLALDCRTGRRAWEFSTAGEVVCGPGAWRNFVFFGSCDGRVYAIHAQSGQQMWCFHTRGEVFSSPAYWNGVVYVGSSDHRLYAINAANGRVLWEFVAAGEIPGAPAMVEDRVYVGSTDRRVYALDAPSGQRLWEYQTEGEIHSSPAVFQGSLYVGSRDHYIYSLDARNGDLRWRFATGDWVHSSPAISGNIMYCGSHDRKLYAVETESGLLTWEYETDGEVQSSPAVSGGGVYVGSNDGFIYCFGTR